MPSAGSNEEQILMKMSLQSTAQDTIQERSTDIRTDILVFDQRQKKLVEA